MTKTAKAPSGYQAGTRVEVKLPDFKAPGMPLVWWPGTIEEIEPMEARGSRILLDILVRMDEDGRPHRELVGPRGGNPRIRKAA